MWMFRRWTGTPFQPHGAVYHGFCQVGLRSVCKGHTGRWMLTAGMSHVDPMQTSRKAALTFGNDTVASDGAVCSFFSTRWIDRFFLGGSLICDDCIQPGAVRDTNRRPHASSCGREAHLAQAGALLRLHVEALVAPKAWSVVRLVRLPGCGVDDATAPAVFHKEARRRVRVE